METEDQRHRGPGPGGTSLSLEHALRPRPGMLPLHWPERHGNPSCARSCLYLPGPSTEKGLWMSFRGGNDSKLPKDRQASIRKLGKRGYTANHPPQPHTHRQIHAHVCRGTCVSCIHMRTNTHTYISRVTPSTDMQGHTSSGHTKVLQHTRGEWTRACRYAQRDTLLCVHTHTHTNTCAGAHRSPGQGPILSRAGRKAQAGSVLDGGVSGHMGRGFTHVGPQLWGALNSPPQRQGCPKWASSSQIH